jgi:hypothetical protein
MVAVNGQRDPRHAVQLKSRVAEMRRCCSGVAVTLEAQSPPLCQKRKAAVESPPLRIEGSGTPPAAAASAITLSLFRLQQGSEDDWSVVSGQRPVAIRVPVQGDDGADCLRRARRTREALY